MLRPIPLPEPVTRAARPVRSKPVISVSLLLQHKPSAAKQGRDGRSKPGSSAHAVESRLHDPAQTRSLALPLIIGLALTGQASGDSSEGGPLGELVAQPRSPIRAHQPGHCVLMAAPLAVSP